MFSSCWSRALVIPLFFFFVLPRPPSSTLFPYTTLFRSETAPPPPRTAVSGHAPRPSSVAGRDGDRKSTRLNSSHPSISYAVFCLKKKTAQLREASHSGERAVPSIHGPARPRGALTQRCA